MHNLLKALTLTGLSSLAMLALPVQAGVIMFQDNFNGDLGTSSLNFTSFTNWTVSNGTVDYIRTPNVWSIDSCLDGCVDMDGSTGNGGRMTTNAIFNLLATNTYKISIDVSGNQRNQTAENLTFGFPSFALFNYGGITSDFFTTYTSTFSGITALSSLILETASNDNIGAIVDNVVLECVTCEIPSVPEPGLFGLMGLGLLGLAIAYKRRVLRLS